MWLGACIGKNEDPQKNLEHNAYTEAGQRSELWIMTRQRSLGWDSQWRKVTGRYSDLTSLLIQIAQCWLPVLALRMTSFFLPFPWNRRHLSNGFWLLVFRKRKESKVLSCTYCFPNTFNLKQSICQSSMFSSPTILKENRVGVSIGVDCFLSMR